MAGFWTVRQLSRVVDRFRDRECSTDLWMRIEIAFGIVIENGPVGAGTNVAKKLTNGGGIWELIASVKNSQPRLLFYERGVRELIFVHAFMKTGGNKDYGPAIKLAQARRSEIERGNRILAGIDFSGKPH